MEVLEPAEQDCPVQSSCGWRGRPATGIGTVLTQFAVSIPIRLPKWRTPAELRRAYRVERRGRDSLIARLLPIPGRGNCPQNSHLSRQCQITAESKPGTSGYRTPQNRHNTVPSA